MQTARAPRRLAAVAALLAIGLMLFLYMRRGAPSAPSEDALLAQGSPRSPSPSPRPEAPAKTPISLPRGAASANPSAEPQTLWQKRLDHAQRTLDGYLAATRYPPTARPIEEQPDQVKPHFVSDNTVPLKRQDEKLTDARVTVHQDRYYVVGEERVTLTIACKNSEGPAPCEVLSSWPRAEGPNADAGTQTTGGGVVIPFTPGPSGVLTATFQPISQGFTDFYGPIRIFVDLRVDGEEGQTSFEIMFTPAAPAVFTGVFREAVLEGSLDIYAGLKIAKAGRYVLAARVDDADGKTFAYLSFNEELGVGMKEAKLHLFGKLILDQKAKVPFRLRDVEGFLLKENTYPDRELIPTLEGVVHTTKMYQPSDFSDKEWQSEEKERHVNEFTKDVDEAKSHVESGE